MVDQQTIDQLIEWLNDPQTQEVAQKLRVILEKVLEPDTEQSDGYEW